MITNTDITNTLNNLERDIIEKQAEIRVLKKLLAGSRARKVGDGHVRKGTQQDMVTKLMRSRNNFVLSSEDISELLPEINPRSISPLLSQLTVKGIIKRVKPAHYQYIVKAV